MSDSVVTEIRQEDVEELVVNNDEAQVAFYEICEVRKGTSDEWASSNVVLWSK